MTARPIGPETRVNNYIQDFQQSPAIATDAQGNYIVVWTSRADDLGVPSPTPPRDDSVSDIYAQRFQADGTPLGDEFRISTYTQAQYRTKVFSEITESLIR